MCAEPQIWIPSTDQFHVHIHSSGLNIVKLEDLYNQFPRRPYIHVLLSDLSARERKVVFNSPEKIFGLVKLSVVRT